MGGCAVLIGAVAATIAGPLLGALTAPWPLLAATLALLSVSVVLCATGRTCKRNPSDELERAQRDGD